MSNLSDGSIARYQSTGINFSDIFNLLKNGSQLVIIYVFANKKCKHPFSIVVFYLAVTYIIIDILTDSMLPILYRFSAYLFIFYIYIFKIILQKINHKGAFIICFAIMVFYYQPIARYIALFNSKGGKESFEYYCSVFSSDKTHYKRVIRSSNAIDYLKSK